MDEMPSEMGVHTTRMYSQNTNGVTLREDGGDLQEVCTSRGIDESDIDVFLSVETKLCHKNRSVKRNLL